jgi:hypothetical protein
MVPPTLNDSRWHMKEQYVGDISDYRKYALLRAFAAQGTIKIGVCWMLTPSDASTDGSKLSYLQKQKFREFDPELFDLLSSVMNAPDKRRLLLIEESGIVPDASYFNAPTPDALAERDAYFQRALAALSACDLIFFDPDNGLDVPSKRKGTRDSSKYLFRDETAATYVAGHSLLIYQHFPRQERNGFIRGLADELSILCPSARVWAFKTSHVVFFLVIHPRHEHKLGSLAATTATRWDSSFISGAELVLATESTEATEQIAEMPAVEMRSSNTLGHKQTVVGRLLAWFSQPRK